eukprot:Lithocolla_globosa_v1_NODE_9475_length_703_cov_3.158951.p1 type:complete len:151 gc:universal NODE_9475_length_703_cov_3.158951:670-218(-)
MADKEEPCEERACNDYEDSKAAMTNSNNRPRKGKKKRVECPPDKSEIGRSTWTLLHTMAAYYPKEPTDKQQNSMHQFLHSFSEFYPCSYCASHLREHMKQHVPDTSSRTALSLWLCQTHNEVNELLGKKQFDCNKLEERWKTGPRDGSCD